MEKIPLYCSTGTFLGRINGRDWRLITKVGPQLDCDGLELLFFSQWQDEEEELVKTLGSSGLRFPTVHAIKNIGDLISSGDTEEALRLYRISARVAQRLGAGLTVLHLWGPPQSDRDFGRNAEALGRILEIADEYSVAVAVENIPCLKSDPMSRLGELAAIYPQVRFTLDTRMAAFHRQFIPMCRGKYDGVAARAIHTHYSDFRGRKLDFKRLPIILQPGEGLADPDKFGAFLRRINYGGGVTMESPALTPQGGDTEILNAGLGRLRRALD